MIFLHFFSQVTVVVVVVVVVVMVDGREAILSSLWHPGTARWCSLELIGLYRV